MARNYFDSNDTRNFCSLTKEAKKYSSDNANALREHYEVKGMVKAVGVALLSFALTYVHDHITAKPKYDKILK